MNRRTFIRSALAGGLFVATPEPVRRFWQIPGSAPVDHRKDYAALSCMYVALHTSDPFTQATVGECSYLGYARQRVPKQRFVDGKAIVAGSDVYFPQCFGGIELVSGFSLLDADGHTIASDTFPVAGRVSAGTCPTLHLPPITLTLD